MTEKSFYWSNIAIGDGVYSTYDDDEFSDIWRKMFMRDRTTQGYIERYENELRVSEPAGGTIRVATGAALVDGKFYETDANVDTVVPAPAVSTRYDRVVLRKSWANQTVRVAIVQGVEGAGVPPAVTQTDGVTWEISLATYSITTLSVITITDDRTPARMPLGLLNASDYVELETLYGDRSSAIISFENISPEYKHLVISGQGRGDGAILESDVNVRFNADSGANYQYQDLRGENAAASAAAATGTNNILIGQAPCASGDNYHASSFEILIPNYINTVFYKQLISKNIHIPNTVVANFANINVGGMWFDSSLIDQIELVLTTASAGNWDIGTIFTLYGLK